MACFIVESGSDPDHVAFLLRLAEQLGLDPRRHRCFADLGGDPQFVGSDRPIVLVPDGADGGRIADTIAFAERDGTHAHTIYIADTIAPDLYKRLLRTGAAEWTTWSDAPRELTEAAGRRSAVSDRGGSASGAAKIVSFVPSKGGVGTTTLALETGIHLASHRVSTGSGAGPGEGLGAGTRAGRRTGLRVAIVDLDLQGGTLADLVDVEPRFDVREIGGDPDRLDEHLVDVMTSRHASQLDVFASPIRRLGPDEIDPQIVFAFLDAISGRYDLVLIDTPHHGVPWIDNLIQGSDAVVMTGGGTVPALKQLRAGLSRLGEIAVPTEKVAAVIGPCDCDLIGRVTRRPEIDKALPEYRRFYIRRDVAAVGAAHDAGQPLMEMAPGSRVARDIRSLADWVGGLTGAPSAASSKVPVRRRLMRRARS